MTSDAISLAAAHIRAADGLIIAAGAGMGVDSGLPDFRGLEGFWQHYPGLARAGLDFTSIANPQAFERTPGLAWGFYGHRLKLYRETKPHAGFGILLEIARSLEHGAFVFTSNVDGQFQKAGYVEERIHEAHGSIHYLQCTQDCGIGIWRADDFDPVVDQASCTLESPPPLCPGCGALARPNVLMFGDWYWLHEREQRQRQARVEWLRNVQRPVIIEIGAGTDIPTVRHFSESVGGWVIRINLREPDIYRRKGRGIKSGGLAALQRLRGAWREEIVNTRTTGSFSELQGI